MPPALGSRRVNSNIPQAPRSSAPILPPSTPTRPQHHSLDANTSNRATQPPQTMATNIASALMTPQREARESSANISSSSRKPRQNLDERDHILMLKACLDLRNTFKTGTKSQFWTGVSTAFQHESGKVLAQMSATVGRLVETRRRQLADWEHGIIREKPGGELNEAIDRWIEFLRAEDTEAEAERMRQVDARRKIEEDRKEARRQSHIAAEKAHQRALAEAQAAQVQAQMQSQAQRHIQTIAPLQHTSPVIAVADSIHGGASDGGVSLVNGQDTNGYASRKRARGEDELNQELQDQLQQEAYHYERSDSPSPPKRVVIEGALTKEDWRDIMGNDARLRALETKVERIELIVSQNNKLLLQLLQNQSRSTRDDEHEQRVPVHLDAEFERDYL